MSQAIDPKPPCATRRHPYQTFCRRGSWNDDCRSPSASGLQWHCQLSQLQSTVRGATGQSRGPRGRMKFESESAAHWPSRSTSCTQPLHHALCRSAPCPHHTWNAEESNPFPASLEWLSRTHRQMELQSRWNLHRWQTLPTPHAGPRCTNLNSKSRGLKQKLWRLSSTPSRTNKWQR